MKFEIVGEIRNIETIAEGPGIRESPGSDSSSARDAGARRKGVATVQMKNGSVRPVELHWYEAHGIGKRKMKIKTYLDR